ncbi:MULTISPECIES: LytR/AlgR family response regulator transcription factor [Bacteroidales]|jgi:DNA-binding LytR/AlgR family response regulator|uniref:LytR/AlgR family response regulator transcription factor n=1 Tax=Bacteroidales TaxID=171549 RepID=UPI00244E08E5|nr:MULTISPECIES: LytTR family DNA-binding domain-containing protein [Bacteroidales]
MTNNTVIRCIAIDDEPIALSVISQFCDRLGNIDIAVYSDPRLGLEAVLRSKPDIVFLDIEMNDINGLSIAKEIGSDVAIIFTTAYLQYALDGYDLDAVDFLHKPFSFDRFKVAMEKASRRVAFLKINHRPKTIIVKQEYANISISTDEIMYIEAMENYAKIYRANGGCIISRSSMKAIMEILPINAFVRIHRSYITPVDKIVSFNRQSVKLSTGLSLPVGRQYVENLLERMSNNYQI